MRLGMNTLRDQQNSATPIFSNIANRINYLQQKNQSVNKKLLSYMNCFERRLLSERSHDSESKDKNGSTFRIHPSKKINLKDDLGKFLSENATHSKRPIITQNNYEAQSESKENFMHNSKKSKIKKEIGFQFSQIHPKHQECHGEVVPLQSLKKGKIFLQRENKNKVINRSLDNQQQPKIALKTDNFLKTLSKINNEKSSYPKILSSLGNRKKHAKKPGQQKLKLIEIKKKLLQEEEESLMEYEKCILYKQKLAQKIKHQNLGPGNNGPEKRRNFEQSEVFIYANEEDS